MVALSETEVPVQDTTIVFRGYTIFYPSPSKTGKSRLLLLLRQDAAALYRAQVIETTHMEIWLVLHLPCGPTMICAVYRQWTDTEGWDLEAFHCNLREYSTRFDRILVIGDVNLDWARRTDPKYYRRKLLLDHCACLEELQLNVANELNPIPTYKSYALFGDGSKDKTAKESILDHLYYVGMAPPTFQVLPYAATDHRPISASFETQESRRTLREVTCRNFKSLDASICWAINAEKLAAVFQHDDVDIVHDIIVKEITDAMDLVVPRKTILVKERRAPSTSPPPPSRPSATGTSQPAAATTPCTKSSATRPTGLSGRTDWHPTWTSSRGGGATPRRSGASPMQRLAGPSGAASPRASRRVTTSSKGKAA